MEKSIIIELEDNGNNTSKFSMKSENMHPYEILGLLRTAILFQEELLINSNTKIT